LVYVYRVTCRDTAKVYVGKTKQKLARRWFQHRRDAAKGRPFALHAAIRKYGEESFSIEPLERMTTEAGAYRAERLWIEQLNCLAPHGYNLDAGGRGLSGPSDETKARMSTSAKKKYADKPELREAAAETLRAFPCRQHSAETRAKISAARKKQAPPGLGKKMSAATRVRIAEGYARHNESIGTDGRSERSRRGGIAASQTTTSEQYSERGKRGAVARWSKEKAQ